VSGNLVDKKGILANLIEISENIKARNFRLSM